MLVSQKKQPNMNPYFKYLKKEHYVIELPYMEFLQPVMSCYPCGEHASLQTSTQLTTEQGSDEKLDSYWQKKVKQTTCCVRSFFFIFKAQQRSISLASYNNNASPQFFSCSLKSKHTADICKQHGHLKILNFEVT